MFQSSAFFYSSCAARVLFVFRGGCFTADMFLYAAAEGNVSGCLQNETFLENRQ